MAIFSSFTELENESPTSEAIVLREEQNEAISRAAKHFKTESNKAKFLWNAKMRFGKTICAMHLAKEMGVKTCLIVTHRPVVNQNWKDDFSKTFGDDKNYIYGTLFKDKDVAHNQNEGDFYELERFSTQEGKHLVFFVSMQYLCLSPEVNFNTGSRAASDNNKLKAAILNKEWDLVVIDEAHEGTRTSLGLRVIDLLSKSNTKVLHLSGTPFNLYQDFKPGEIYTWDYIKEQRAKANCETQTWKEANPGKHNPYAGLPRLKIFTYDLANLLDSYRDEEQAFKFSEFFRTWSNKRDKGNIPEGKADCFVHEEDVNKFLDLLCEKSDETGYPFSTDEYRKNFRHTLWVVPGVSEAKALTTLLNQHAIFKYFKVINVAGNSEDDETRANALDKVLNEIGDRPDNRFTITISCGRLTTGVTVPPWTAVLYLKGSDNTAASTYLQTIFRVQSPWEFSTHATQWRKTECYVFDFAPNRALKMMAETAKFSLDTDEEAVNNKKKGKGKRPSNQDDLTKMKEFLNFCPVVAMAGGQMREFNADELFAQLDRVYIDRVVRNGFNDNSLYNERELLKLDPEALNRLHEIISKTSNLDKPEKAKKIDLTANPKNAVKSAGGHGTEGGTYATPEEDAQKQEERERRKKEREERDNRITILRGISLRIPLLIYGAELSDESAGITIDNFTSIVDDASWAEFMPRGVSKEDFNSFKIAYNPTVFVESGKRIRSLAREADSMPTDLRIQRVAEIFSYFHNPDKETVLTPWRVVNMHMSDCIGGFCFFNEKFDGPNQKEIIDDATGETTIIDTPEPRFVSRGTVTTDIFADYNHDTLSLNSKILEINSKTGLYPLYIAYSLFRFRSAHFVEANLIKNPQNLSIEEEQVIWDDIIRDNIFVICNTPMAKAITKRTLLGFRELKFQPNIKSEKLTEQAASNKLALIEKLMTEGFWNGNKKNEKKMKFNAIVGNPPYQVNVGKEKENFAIPIFNNFVDISKSLNPNYISMIIPARWFGGGRGLENFRHEMLNDKRIQQIHDFINSDDCFPNVTIAGGICYFLWNESHKGLCSFSSTKGNITSTLPRKLNEYDVFIRYNETINLLYRITKMNLEMMNNQVSSQTPFGFITTYRNKPQPFDKSIEVLCSNKEFTYVTRDMVGINKELIDMYKVIFNMAVPERGGMPDKNGQYRIFSSLQILSPGQICTQTFLVGRSFNNVTEAKNCLKYLSTKFVRFLVAITLASQHLGADKFRFVPVQDFTSNSDIDWNVTINEIDDQIFTKYQINVEERLLISNMIRPL